MRSLIVITSVSVETTTHLWFSSGIGSRVRNRTLIGYGHIVTSWSHFKSLHCNIWNIHKEWSHIRSSIYPPKRTPPIPHSFITLLTVGSYPSPLFYQVWGPVLRKLKLPSSTVCLLHVLRLTIKRCHLRCIIVNICLNDGGRADVLERNKNRLSLYLPSCEFSVSVEKKQKKTKKVEQRTGETTKCFRLQRAKRFTQPTTTPPKTIDGVSRCFIQR